MPATFTFDLPSAAGCMARPCGEGHRCFLLLTDAAKQKSSDGSGVLIGTITSVAKVNLTLWRFVVEVADSEFLSAPSANEMQLSLSCMDAESDALLRKIEVAGAAVTGLDVWSPDAAFRHNETVLGGVLEQWIGTVPRNFAVAAVRLSVANNNGRRLYVNIHIGFAAITIAQLDWPYVDTEDSRLYPVSAWNGTALAGNIMPAGARVAISTEMVGAYGTEITGLKLDFLGRWVS